MAFPRSDAVCRISPHSTVRKIPSQPRERKQGVKHATGTYVEQQVESTESVDRLLKDTLDERFVGDVTVE